MARRPKTGDAGAGRSVAELVNTALLFSHSLDSTESGIILMTFGGWNNKRIFAIYNPHLSPPQMGRT